MKTKLEQLTMKQFISLACGEASVLFDRHEIPNPAKAEGVMRSIVMEYETIACKTAVRTYLSDSEELNGARLALKIFLMCLVLVRSNRFDDVRDILDEYGLNAGRMSDERLVAEVESGVERAKKDISDLESDRHKEESIEDIRRGFDEQTAVLMSHFKFQINVREIMATEYACLVAQFDREMKIMKKYQKK